MFSNELTPAESERLALLSEEMGEAIQAIGKILRHGYESTGPKTIVRNRTSLEKELGDDCGCKTRLLSELVMMVLVFWSSSK